MSDFLCYIKPKIENFLKRAFPFVCVAFFWVFSPFSVSALNFSAYDGYNVYFSNYVEPNVSKIQVNSYDSNNNWVLGFEQTTEYIDGVHHVQNSDLIGYNVVNLSSSGYPFLFPVNTDVYDYYLVGVIQYLGGNQVNWTPNRVQVTYRAADGSNVYASHYFSTSGNNLIANNVGETRGFSWSVKLDLSSNAGIQNISLIAPYSSTSFIGSYIDFAASVVQVHKSVSQTEVNSIITAINNQTSTIINAGSDNSGLNSEITTESDSLSQFIDDYTEIEQSMHDKFNENQIVVSSDFANWGWGSLSTAVDWTSDYLNRIYDNSGDFRTMFLYPILAGIALIFIGRQGLSAYVRSKR